MLIQSLLTERFSGQVNSESRRALLTLITRAPLVSVDQVVSDFDGVTFHLSTPESKSKILISLSVKCYNELLKYGAQEVLKREYGPYIVSPEAGYDFSVLIDLESLPNDAGGFNRQYSGHLADSHICEKNRVKI